MMRTNLLLTSLAAAYWLPPPPPCSSLQRRALPPSADLAAAGHEVADWAVAAGRGSATVAVSGRTTLAGVLHDFWSVAHAFALEEDSGGQQRVLALPQWQQGASDPKLFAAVLQHIASCTELCEYVGESLIVAGRHPAAAVADGETTAPCPMLLLRNYRSGGGGGSGGGSSAAGGATALPESFSSPYDDPYADVSDDVSDDAAEFASDELVLGQTREWVGAIIVEMKVCPFSSTADKAGAPIGGVSYPITHATIGEEVYTAFWGQVLELEATDEKTLATVLLLTPRFCASVHSAGGYDLLSDTLNGALTELGLEDQCQLVFFHPGYTFRDGKARLGDDDGAANFARRSPYPMINLLRTPQVRLAQKGIPTGSVYEVNEKNLERVGARNLQQMLDKGDWTGISDHNFMKHAENLWR